MSFRNWYKPWALLVERVPGHNNEITYGIHLACANSAIIIDFRFCDWHKILTQRSKLGRYENTYQNGDRIVNSWPAWPCLPVIRSRIYCCPVLSSASRNLSNWSLDLRPSADRSFVVWDNDVTWQLIDSTSSVLRTPDWSSSWSSRECLTSRLATSHT